MARENTPETLRSAGWKRLKTNSKAELISPSVQRTRAACTEAAGTWHGANVHCEKVECTFETGACCYGSFCLLMTEWECGQHGGDWHGAGTLCADAVCDKPKPGDLDQDGKVDIGDLLKLFEYWGS